MTDQYEINENPCCNSVQDMLGSPFADKLKAAREERKKQTFKNTEIINHKDTVDEKAGRKNLQQLQESIASIRKALARNNNLLNQSEGTQDEPVKKNELKSINCDNGSPSYNKKDLYNIPLQDSDTSSKENSLITSTVNDITQINSIDTTTLQDEDKSTEEEVYVETICYQCNKPILSEYELPCVLKGLNFHYSCLRCGWCGECMEGEYLVPTDRPVSYHERCWDEAQTKTAHRLCGACHAHIPTDQPSYNACDRLWHLECFHCTYCGLKLKDSLYFLPKMDQLYHGHCLELAEASRRVDQHCSSNRIYGIPIKMESTEMESLPPTDEENWTRRPSLEWQRKPVDIQTHNFKSHLYSSLPTPASTILTHRHSAPHGTYCRAPTPPAHRRPHRQSHTAPNTPRDITPTGISEPFLKTAVDQVKEVKEEVSMNETWVESHTLNDTIITSSCSEHNSNISDFLPTPCTPRSLPSPNCTLNLSTPTINGNLSSPRLHHDIKPSPVNTPCNNSSPTLSDHSNDNSTTQAPPPPPPSSLPTSKPTSIPNSPPTVDEVMKALLEAEARGYQRALQEMKDIGTTPSSIELQWKKLEEEREGLQKTKMEMILHMEGQHKVLEERWALLERQYKRMIAGDLNVDKPSPTYNDTNGEAMETSSSVRSGRSQHSSTDKPEWQNVTAIDIRQNWQHKMQVWKQQARNERQKRRSLTLSSPTNTRGTSPSLNDSTCSNISSSPIPSQTPPLQRSLSTRAPKAKPIPPSRASPPRAKPHTPTITSQPNIRSPSKDLKKKILPETKPQSSHSIIPSEQRSNASKPEDVHNSITNNNNTVPLDSWQGRVMLVPQDMGSPPPPSYSPQSTISPTPPPPPILIPTSPTNNNVTHSNSDNSPTFDSPQLQPHCETPTPVDPGHITLETLSHTELHKDSSVSQHVSRQPSNIQKVAKVRSNSSFSVSSSKSNASRSSTPRPSPTESPKQHNQKVRAPSNSRPSQNILRNLSTHSPPPNSGAPSKRALSPDGTDLSNVRKTSLLPPRSSKTTYDCKGASNRTKSPQPPPSSQKTRIQGSFSYPAVFTSVHNDRPGNITTPTCSKPSRGDSEAQDNPLISPRESTSPSATAHRGCSPPSRATPTHKPNVNTERVKTTEDNNNTISAWYSDILDPLAPLPCMTNSIPIINKSSATTQSHHRSSSSSSVGSVNRTRSSTSTNIQNTSKSHLNRLSQGRIT